MKIYLRTLDASGCVSIPKEILRANLIEPEALLHIKVIAEGILISPAEGSCALCGEVENLIEAGNGFVCKSCLERLNNADIQNR